MKIKEMAIIVLCLACLSLSVFIWGKGFERGRETLRNEIIRALAMESGSKHIDEFLITTHKGKSRITLNGSEYREDTK